MNPTDIFLNPVLIVSGLVWLLAETTKVVTARLIGRPAGVFDSGGMPSGHAAAVSAATATIALDQGLASPLFGFAVVVAGIVLHDSFRVRWMAGETAERVNRSGKGKDLVKVHRGHRLSEVVVGTAFGIVLAAVLYGWIYG